MKKLLQLFAAFFKIGAFTFGGGYAMLELMKVELCQRKNWCTEEELVDYFALSQCTPGAIAVNVATFVGRKASGAWGGIWATLGVVAPSFIIIIIIARFLKNFAQYEITSHIFGGIRIIVAVLVVNAVFTIGKSAVQDKICLCIAVCSCLLSFFFQLSPIYFVIAGACAGLLFKRGKKGGNAK